MRGSSFARAHALVSGSLNGAGGSKEERAWDLCRQYIERKVSGVFFAPLEFAPAKDDVNRRVIAALADAHIPLILLDRTPVPTPSVVTRTLSRSTTGAPVTSSRSIS